MTLRTTMHGVLQRVCRMDRTAHGRVDGSDALTPALSRSRLFRKYVALFLAVVGLALIPNGLVDTWFSYQEFKVLLVRIQSEQARSAADKIEQFIRGIEGQLTWATQLPLSAKTDEDWRFDAVRLLRQVPAITEVAQLDASGRERFRLSREAMDVVGSLSDLSKQPFFIEAMTNKVYYGPVHFVRESEPHMTIAVAGTRPDQGVIVAQVNLKFIWDVISHIKVGRHGQAYVIDRQGRLIAHPDISLVLRNTNLSQLAHVQTARASQRSESLEQIGITKDLKGRKVLSAYAPVLPLGWLVFADLPVAEAYGPLYDNLIRSSVLLIGGFILAIFAALLLARRMVVPIRTLSVGAARIGSGNLTQKIKIKSGDELEELGEQFNRMAAQLHELYATLEYKVEERTRQLEIANHAKSRFLAAASHDLRQPLHALGLFVAQLHGRINAGERKRLISGMDAALSAMNELFNALLDVSKLDAGALDPHITEFPVARMLGRVEPTFAGAARQKGLSLRVVPSSGWVRSDFILLERIVSNLVSNAIRYTDEGGVVVGCRRRAGQLRIEVWDTGPGIPLDQQRNIFGEFYRLGKSDHDHRGGLGLGLAIVERLCGLINHSVDLASAVGKGSCFSIGMREVRPAAELNKPEASSLTRMSSASGKLVVVIDNDPLVLESMGGLIRSWGCRVVTGCTESAALAGLAEFNYAPNVIISDYHLHDGKTGIETIKSMRNVLSAPIPGFLMSGDINPEPLREAQANGYSLLHKPVDPAALRAMLARMLKKPLAAQARPL